MKMLVQGMLVQGILVRGYVIFRKFLRKLQIVRRGRHLAALGNRHPAWPGLVLYSRQSLALWQRR